MKFVRHIQHEVNLCGLELVENVVRPVARFVYNELREIGDIDIVIDDGRLLILAVNSASATLRSVLFKGPHVKSTQARDMSEGTDAQVFANRRIS